MALKSTPDHYGTMAVSIHWISVVLILFLIGSGFRATGAIDPVAKAEILRLHVPIALAVLALTILRIVWWWSFDRKPRPVAGLWRGNLDEKSATIWMRFLVAVTR
jgi:cytochrome b561